MTFLVVHFVFYYTISSLGRNEEKKYLPSLNPGCLTRLRDNIFIIKNIKNTINRYTVYLVIHVWTAQKEKIVQVNSSDSLCVFGLELF